MSSLSNNVLDALEQSRRTLGFNRLDHKGIKTMNSGRVFTLILFAFIVLMLLLFILAGTRLYSSLNQMRDQTDNDRAALALLTNTVRANDTIDSVAMGQGPEGRSLVLIQANENGTYETRIYEYNGNIVQEYALASSPYTPERADVLAVSDVFDFSYKNGLLTLYTDEGTSRIDLRSVRKGG